MNNAHEHITTLGDKVTIAGSAGTILGWATSSTFGMWMGILIGVTGLLINWYFKSKADRRNQEAHDMHMERMRRGLDSGHHVGPETDE